MTLEHVFVAVLAIAFFDGLRCTIGLYHDHRGQVPPRNRITFAFVVVATLCTAAAGFFGFLTVRRWLGFEQIPAIGLVSLIVSSAVLFIPHFLRWTVARIRRSPA